MGYHCEIFKESNIPQIAVIGLNSAKMQQKIYYNLSNGKFIKEVHKEPVGGGLYINNKKVNLFSENNWGVIGVNGSENGYIAWGYKMIDNITLNPFLIQVTDSIKSNINIEDMVIYSWMSKQNTIFALTESNIIKTNNYGEKWDMLFEKDFKIIDYFIDNSDSIYVLTSEELFHVKNSGKSIDTISIPQNMIRIIKDKSSSVLYAIIDGKLCYFDNTDWKMVGDYADLQTLDALSDYIIISTKNKISILKNNKIIYSTKQDLQYNYYLYPKGKNDFYIVNNNVLYDYKYKGGETWKMNSYFKDEYISYITEINNIVYLCTIPQLIWTSSN